MGALGQRVPAHIRALDKTLIGDDCWEYGGKIRTDGYGSVFVHNGTRAGGTALAHRVVYEGLVACCRCAYRGTRTLTLLSLYSD